MTWYAVYDKNTGELYSTGSVLADEAILRVAGLEFKEINGPQEGRLWNAQTRTFGPYQNRVPIRE